MGVKTIFTDIDGVLNCSKTTKRLAVDNRFTFVDTRKVLRLRDIVERTGAQLVLSSSWRHGILPSGLFLDKMAYIELVEEFRRLRCPIWTDVTPYLPKAKRWQEINAWLMLHPEVDEFIILDDWYDELKPFSDKLVLTDARVGLTKERAEFAVRKLGEKQ